METTAPAATAAPTKAEARAIALKGKKDSVVRGSLDLWPLLRMDTADLVAEIVAGKCDGVLSELGEMAAAHPTKSADGAFKERGTVIDAVKARQKKA